MKLVACPHCSQLVSDGHEALHECPESYGCIAPGTKVAVPHAALTFCKHGIIDKCCARCVEDGTTRKGNWMQTFTGRQFWPLDPRPEEICIEDIAHSLSMYCRFGGHCKEFYPVGEHSLFVMRLVPEKDKLQALLHDAPEAYLGDVINPLKRMLPEYQRAEHAVWLAVCERFDISPCLSEAVRYADRIAVMTERRDICSPPPASWGPGFEDVPPAVAHVRAGVMPYRIEDDFLVAFAGLTKNKI